LGVGAGHQAGREPVESLTASLRQVTAGNWAARVEIPAGGEAGQLAREFNEMTRRLSEERARLVQTERVAAWRDVAQRLTQEVKQSLFPLEITVGSLTRARAESAPRFAETLTESLAALRSDLDHLKASVMRFGEFAKMPSPRLKPLDVNELLRVVLKDFEPQFRVVGRPPITPELYLDGSLGKIQGDADLLHKALDNLLLHSIDTMPAGGALTIRTGQASGIVRIEISAGGVSTASDQSVRPFSPFRTGQGEGAGLGLATTQAVVSDHGGKFFAEPVPGVGTTFRLEFAIAPEIAQGIAPPAAVYPAAPRREMPEIPRIPQVEAEATMPALEPSLPESALPEPLLKND
jgi:two-component system, NtrC family, nitrogen regulation sensor histidine kinase NtrY